MFFAKFCSVFVPWGVITSYLRETSVIKSAKIGRGCKMLNFEKINISKFDLHFRIIVRFCIFSSSRIENEKVLKVSHLVWSVWFDFLRIWQYFYNRGRNFWVKIARKCLYQPISHFLKKSTFLILDPIFQFVWWLRTVLFLKHLNWNKINVVTCNKGLWIACRETHLAFSMFFVQIWLQKST